MAVKKEKEPQTITKSVRCKDHSTVYMCNTVIMGSLTTGKYARLLREFSKMTTTKMKHL